MRSELCTNAWQENGNHECEIIESDHSFTNKRKEIGVYINAWLKKTEHNTT